MELIERWMQGRISVLSFLDTEFPALFALGIAIIDE
jgi:hypothetical protein